MKQLLFAVTLFSLSLASATATPQEKSQFILEGRLLATYDFPSLADAFPNIVFPEFRHISTANHKGYTATWATFQNQLHLVGLEACVPGKDELLRNEEITPGHKFPLKVTEWSGSITHVDESWRIEGPDLARFHAKAVTTVTFKNGTVTGVEVKLSREPIKEPDASGRPSKEGGEQHGGPISSEGAPSAPRNE